MVNENVFKNDASCRAKAGVVCELHRVIGIVYKLSTCTPALSARARARYDADLVARACADVLLYGSRVRLQADLAVRQKGFRSYIKDCSTSVSLCPVLHEEVK